MRRTMWAVVILTLLLLVSASTGPNPPDSLATLAGMAIGAFAFFYLIVDYTPRKVQSWRATD